MLFSLFDLSKSSFLFKSLFLIISLFCLHELFKLLFFLLLSSFLFFFSAFAFALLYNKKFFKQSIKLLSFSLFGSEVFTLIKFPLSKGTSLFPFFLFKKESKVNIKVLFISSFSIIFLYFLSKIVLLLVILSKEEKVEELVKFLLFSSSLSKEEFP